MKPLIQIRDEITAWAAKNFPVHLPSYGILEEVGELTHVLLKSAQGIRGYDDPRKKKVDLVDALADTSIYALHFCGLNKIVPPTSFNVLKGLTEAEVLMNLAYSAGAILSSDARLAQHNIPILFDNLNTMAVMTDVELIDVINDTWTKVSQRNWIENPGDADKKAAAPAPAANTVTDKEPATKQVEPPPQNTVTQPTISESVANAEKAATGPQP